MTVRQITRTLEANNIDLNDLEVSKNIVWVFIANERGTIDTDKTRKLADKIARIFTTPERNIYSNGRYVSFTKTTTASNYA